MDKFLETFYLPRLNQEETENLNRPITSNQSSKNTHETKVQDQTASQVNSTKQTASQVNSTKHLEELISILLKLFQTIDEKGMLLNSFYNTSITMILKPDKDSTKTKNYRPISLMHIDAKILNKILAN